MRMVAEGEALCVPRNHDMKLMRKLKGRDVQMTHGLADSVQQLDKESPEFKQAVIKFLDDLVSHYVFDDGKLVVRTRGQKEEMQGRGSGKVRDFALYGETGSIHPSADSTRRATRLDLAWLLHACKTSLPSSVRCTRDVASAIQI